MTTTLQGPVLPGEPQSRPVGFTPMRVLPPDTDWVMLDPGSPMVRFESSLAEDYASASDPVEVFTMMRAFQADGVPFTVQLCCHSDDAELALQQTAIDAIGETVPED